jgi:hypothetical protein
MGLEHAVDAQRSWVAYTNYLPIGQFLSARGWAGTHMRFTELGEIEGEKFAFHSISFGIFPSHLSCRVYHLSWNLKYPTSLCSHGQEIRDLHYIAAYYW